MIVKRLKHLFTIWLPRLIRLIKGAPFNGAWGTFQYLDDTCKSIEALQEQGFRQITTHSPCPRKELEDVLNYPESALPVFTFLSGLAGATVAVTMVVWMSLQWVLPVSEKPIVSYFPTLVIGFELTILFGVFGTLAGMVILGKWGSARMKLPESKPYKQYNRFSQDRFGVVVRCAAEQVATVAQIMESCQAEEVFREN